MKRDETIVANLKAAVEEAQESARLAEGDGDTELAESYRRDSRGAQSRLDEYLVSTRNLADDYPIQSAADELEAKRMAKGRYEAAEKKKAERAELLRQYPSARTEADGPETFWEPPKSGA